MPCDCVALGSSVTAIGEIRSQSSGDDGAKGIPGQAPSSANGHDNYVNGTRDLVNFFPMSLENLNLRRQP